MQAIIVSQSNTSAPPVVVSLTNLVSSILFPAYVLNMSFAFNSGIRKQGQGVNYANPYTTKKV